MSHEKHDEMVQFIRDRFDPGQSLGEFLDTLDSGDEDDFGNPRPSEWEQAWREALGGPPLGGTPIPLTVVIQIDNSDDKLPQAQWARFVKDLRRVVDARCSQSHFSGSSPGEASWQDYCVVAECLAPDIPGLRLRLQDLAGKYQQDTIALTRGNTEFLRP